MEILLAIALGFGGGWWLTPTKVITDCTDPALIVSSCPPLTMLEDPSFGSHIIKLQEVAGQYKECRKACLK